MRRPYLRRVMSYLQMALKEPVRAEEKPEERLESPDMEKYCEDFGYKVGDNATTANSDKNKKP